MRRFIAGVVWALGLFGASTADARSLDVEAELAVPDTRLLVVEFFATWCQPCMKAVPRWEALRTRYARRGLRFLVVAVKDDAERCADVPWHPDGILCDTDGALAKAFGVGGLPAAFVWNWQGDLLASRVHVQDVEENIEGWLGGLPRVDLSVTLETKRAGLSRGQLRRRVASELGAAGKLIVVASRAEKRKLRAMAQRSYALGSDEALQCEVGREVSANNLLKVAITRGAKQIRLGLLSVERACRVRDVFAPWDPRAPGRSVTQAVAQLLASLKRPSLQLPPGARTPRRPPPRTSAKVDAETLRLLTRVDEAQGALTKTNSLFTSYVGVFNGTEFVMNVLNQRNPTRARIEFRDAEERLLSAVVITARDAWEVKQGQARRLSPTERLEYLPVLRALASFRDKIAAGWSFEARRDRTAGAWVVRETDLDGLVTIYAINEADALVTRISNDKATQYLSAYRQIGSGTDGFPFPHVQELESGAGGRLAGALNCQTVLRDVPVDDRLFAVPRALSSGGRCQGDHVALWRGVQSRLALAADCSLEVEQGPCRARGRYGGPLPDGEGSLMLQITQNQGPVDVCIPANTYTCSYTKTRGTLITRCPFGTFRWERR